MSLFMFIITIVLNQLWKGHGMYVCVLHLVVRKPDLTHPENRGLGIEMTNIEFNSLVITNEPPHGKMNNVVSEQKQAGSLKFRI